MFMSVTHKNSLEKCIQDHLDEETADGKYLCEKCKVHSKPKIRHELLRLPKVMVFHIKRFDTLFKKIKANTKYPANLDL